MNYATAPDNLIEGRLSATVTVEFPASASELALTIYKNGAAINADWSTTNHKNCRYFFYLKSSKTRMNQSDIYILPPRD